MEAKQFWQTTKEEILSLQPSERWEEAKDPNWVESWRWNMIIQHKNQIKQALRDNKPVPKEVLLGYKGEKWADEALLNYKE